MADPRRSLLGDPIPARPSYIGPIGAPPGVAVDFKAYRSATGGEWWKGRPIIHPTLLIAHTNGAGNEASQLGAVNGANRDKSAGTHAHYNMNAPVVTKHLPTNRRAIANNSGRELEIAAGVRDVSYWSLAVESSDRGYLHGGGVDLGPFLYDHAEMLARIMAYESIWAGFPLQVPARWHDPGVVTHTAPFPYPHYTNARGKTCPGTTKIWQFFNIVLPRAREIRDAWQRVHPAPAPAPAPVPAPPPVIQPGFRVIEEQEDAMAIVNPHKVIYDSRDKSMSFGIPLIGGMPFGIGLPPELKSFKAIECSITVLNPDISGHICVGKSADDGTASIAAFVGGQLRECTFAIVPVENEMLMMTISKGARAHVLISAQGARR